MIKKIILLIPLCFVLISCSTKNHDPKATTIFIKKKKVMTKPQKRTDIFFYYNSPKYDLYEIWDVPEKEEPKPIEEHPKEEKPKKKKKDHYFYEMWWK